jgi:predicted acetyltransferase
MILNNLVLTTLSQNSEYFDNVIQLIEEEFHYNQSHHYEKDFALLMDPLNFENCFLFIDKNNNTVAAHLAVCIRTLKKNNIETKVALIGGIVTHRNYRGQNLFKNLMDHVLSLYLKNVSLFILWSDIEGLYEKFFFYRTGGIIETGKRDINVSENALGFEKTTFHATSEKDFNAIKKMYSNFNENYFFTLKREEKDWSIIKEMNSINLYLKRNPHGDIYKSFCVNKGQDLTNIIHEVSAINLDEYLSLLKELKEYKLWLPETESDKYTTVETFYSSFIKIGNKDLLNHFLESVSDNQLKVEDIEKNSITFNFQKKAYNTTSKEFLQYLFGPAPLKEFAPFKLSLYITGTDSV